MHLSVVDRANNVGASHGAGLTNDPLAAFGVQLVFRRNDELVRQEDPTEFVYRLLSGVVRTTRLADDGRRQIGAFHYAGDLIGLEDGDIHLFSAEALCDCSVLAVRRTTLEAEAARNGDIARLLWTAGSKRLREMQQHMVHIGRKSAIERVAAILADLAGRAGRDEVDLPMSRQDIADYLSLTIETVSRMFSQLQARNVISLTGLRCMRVCNPAALQRLAA